jgi:hypothetical protein
MSTPEPRAVNDDADTSGSAWPEQLGKVFERALTCEYASLTRAGAPVTVPSTPYVGSGTLDVSTGLSYPAKAERARRNPKVALLFADAIGSAAAQPPVVLVQGRAAVRDADLQGNTDRYARVAIAKLPEATKGQPKFLLRRMKFYYARIWIEIVPQRIVWWESRELAGEPQVWQADAGRPLPQSDPAPSGRQPAAWLTAPSDWRAIAARALRELPMADLTFVGADGYPVCLPVSPGALDGDEVPLGLGAGALELRDGPACLTVHGHDERFTTQENHTLIGSLAQGERGPALRVERALADWSLTGSRAQIALGFMRKGRMLSPRLKGEAARRGQPVPEVRLS